MAPCLRRSEPYLPNSRLTRPPGHAKNVARQRFIVNYFDRRYEQEPQRTQLGNLQHGDGYRFRGRGYAQVTGRRNYALFSPLVSVDLIVNPDLALKVDVAYRILTIGSRQGLFTGRKLGDYISANRNDFVNARRVINGVDHAQDIADEANRFYRFLQTSALEGLKEKLATYPSIKPQLNQAIASYNVAETAFQAYEKSKDPNALAALPATITDLEQKISAVQLVFSTPATKP
jgi:hypothetical protein